MPLKHMKTMNQILKKILFFLIIIAIILSACVFNYYIRIQSKLDMEELNQMVEKEIIQYHGKH